jgi:hypothetical protein
MEMVGIYNSGSDKLNNMSLILEQLLKKFSSLATSPETIYEIKVFMETQFMRIVKCNYMYLLVPTPDKHGCDLREIIFNIAPDKIRDKILGTISHLPRTRRIPHIITDIDDTLYPSFNGLIETVGSDRSWNTNKPYPGIKLFYELFHKNIPQVAARYSSILTGTPLFLKNKRLESEILKDILGTNFGFMHGFDKKRQAIYALLKGLCERPFYKFAISSHEVAAVKFFKFKQYTQLFPEYDILFIGDNGQGDLIAGKKMIHHDQNVRVFIHNIFRGNNYIFSSHEEMAEQDDLNGRLYFFKNYLELGYIFHKIGYLSERDFAVLRLKIANTIKTDIPTNYNLDNISACPEYNKYRQYLSPNPIYPEYVCLSRSQIKKQETPL